MQSFTLLFGVLLAVAVVCTQLFQVQGMSTSKKEVKTELGNTATEDESAYISLPSFSIPAPVHVQVALDSYCLFEILFSENNSERNSIEQPVIFTKLFHTLFRVIISPNAP